MSNIWAHSLLKVKIDTFFLLKENMSHLNHLTAFVLFLFTLSRWISCIFWLVHRVCLWFTRDMNRLFSHHDILKDNLLFLIGLCLCFYFSYHTVLGNRSIVKYYSLEKQIETLSLKNDAILHEKENLHKKVVMMRPGQVDKDLLEEQVRQKLGYRASNEMIILGN